MIPICAELVRPRIMVIFENVKCFEFEINLWYTLIRQIKAPQTIGAINVGFIDTVFCLIDKLSNLTRNLNKMCYIIMFFENNVSIIYIFCREVLVIYYCGRVLF